MNKQHFLSDNRRNTHLSDVNDVSRPEKVSLIENLWSTYFKINNTNKQIGALNASLPRVAGSFGTELSDQPGRHIHHSNKLH